MKIKPVYITFEQAKWLKELGFNEKCETSYYTHYEKLMIENNGVTKITPMHNYSRPEQWQVVEWLRVEKGIWVTLYPYDEFREDIFSFLIVKRNGNIKDKYPYMSPQEAYSAAFDFILTNNLI
jgi:hypothetical protein